MPSAVRRRLLLGLLGLSGSATAATWQKVFSGASSGTWQKVPAGSGGALTWRKLGAPPRVTVNLTAANVNNYNIFANRGGTYVAGLTDSVLTTSGTIGSAAAGIPALDTGTGWAVGDTLTLVNNGTIRGCAGTAGVMGASGAGGVANLTNNVTTAKGSNGGPGSAGGTGGAALRAQFALKVTNNGVIQSGAGGAGSLGGGGGGGAGMSFVRSGYASVKGGNGGKGQGAGVALTMGGAGAPSSYVDESTGLVYSGRGGEGCPAGTAPRAGWMVGSVYHSNWGDQTSDYGTLGWVSGGNPGAAGAAGAAGPSVQGSGNVTWVVAGTISGALA